MFDRKSIKSFGFFRKFPFEFKFSLFMIENDSY